MSNLDIYVSNLPQRHARLLTDLRQVILQSLPYCEERISYNTPFFYYLKRLCYLYLPSKKKNIVALGFCDGAQLSNSNGLLTGDGKIVRLIEMDVNKKHNLNQIREVLQEAVLLQDYLYKKK